MEATILPPKFSVANYNIFEIINFKSYQALPRWFPADPDPIFLANLNRWKSNIAWHSRYRSRFPHSPQYMALRSITKDDIEQLAKVLAHPSFNINQPIDTKYQLTALQYAAINNKFAVIQLLLLHGANINKPDKEGNTPLMLAVANQSLQSINSLLKNGCNKNITNIYGKTAVSKAIQEEATHVADFIQKYPPTARKYPKFKVKLDIQTQLNSPISMFFKNYKFLNSRPMKNPFNNFKGEYRISLSNGKTLDQLVQQKSGNAAV